MSESGSDGERMAVLRAYAVGVMSRSVAMRRLGLDWYGQLVDAMAAAGLRVHVTADAEQHMGASLTQVFGDRDRSVTTVRRRPAAAAAELAGASSAVLRRSRRRAGAAPMRSRGIRFGWLRGQIVVPDDFDAPLPADIFSD